MEKASDGEICAAMCADVLPCIPLHADALSIGHEPRDSPNNPPCVCDHPVFFEDKSDRCISCGRLTPMAQHLLAVKYINNLEEKLACPDYQCANCGSMGPFTTTRDDYNGDYDMECPNCGSTKIRDTPREAFREFQEDRDQQLKDLVYWSRFILQDSEESSVELDVLDIRDMEHEKDLIITLTKPKL